MSEMADVLQA
jgi:hypothetical protein